MTTPSTHDNVSVTTSTAPPAPVEQKVDVYERFNKVYSHLLKKIVRLTGEVKVEDAVGGIPEVAIPIRDHFVWVLKTANSNPTTVDIRSKFLSGVNDDIGHKMVKGVTRDHLYECDWAKSINLGALCDRLSDSNAQSIMKDIGVVLTLSGVNPQSTDAQMVAQFNGIYTKFFTRLAEGLGTIEKLTTHAKWAADLVAADRCTREIVDAFNAKTSSTAKDISTSKSVESLTLCPWASELSLDRVYARLLSTNDEAANDFIGTICSLISQSTMCGIMNGDAFGGIFTDIMRDINMGTIGDDGRRVDPMQGMSRLMTKDGLNSLLTKVMGSITNQGGDEAAGADVLNMMSCMSGHDVTQAATLMSANGDGDDSDGEEEEENAPTQEEIAEKISEMSEKMSNMMSQFTNGSSSIQDLQKRFASGELIGEMFQQFSGGANGADAANAADMIQSMMGGAAPKK